ncbi:MAG TPA: hypothetical protein VHP35_01075, partial [Terriglobia bacterium]|nr:hypothetical protein [Terriglobia bacterium]
VEDLGGLSARLSKMRLDQSDCNVRMVLLSQSKCGGGPGPSASLLYASQRVHEMPGLQEGDHLGREPRQAFLQRALPSD